jgi:signal transduction histidine kinase
MIGGAVWGSPIASFEVPEDAFAVRAPPSLSTARMVGPLAVAGLIVASIGIALVCLLAGLETDIPVLVATFLLTATLPLAFWFPDRGAYVDGHGRPVGLPPAVALERERLTAHLRAHREELRASRARLVEAADDERRRMARDLHDGLQSRLVLLAIQAHTVRTNGASDGALALEQGLQAAITELRELVQGLMPAALTERGLCAAIEDLVDRVPIPTELVLPSARDRFPAPTESAGYFVVSEAISNALKHAHTRALSIRLEQLADTLRLEIRDDGVGGATVGSGSGLRSIADRVDAADGHFRFESPAGAGTRIVVELPSR